MKKCILVLSGVVVLYVSFKYVYIECVQNQFDVEVFESKGYSCEDIYWFCEMGFYKDEKIVKWNKNIKVQIANIADIKQSKIDEVDSIIAILSPLIYPLKITKVEDGGNLIVYREVDDIPSGNDAMGRAMVTKGFDGNILKATIYDLKVISHPSVILHEFEHALGLSHPNKPHSTYLNLASPGSPNDFKSLEEYEEYEKNKFPLSKQEKQVIRMLYSPYFKSGLTLKTFMKKMGLKDKK